MNYAVIGAVLISALRLYFLLDSSTIFRGYGTGKKLLWWRCENVRYERKFVSVDYLQDIYFITGKWAKSNKRKEEQIAEQAGELNPSGEIMSETVFTKVDYDLGGLVKFIAL